MSAKPGLVMMHMGDGKGGLDPIFYVLDHADVPLKNLLPTHMTRKKELLEQGVELIRRVTEELPNVRVDCSRELVADYAKRNRARVLVKGLRAVSDYESEIQMAMINAKLNARLDTVFLYTRPKYAYLSSTVVKELARYGADLSDFVPRQIIEQVRAKVADSAGQ